MGFADLTVEAVAARSGAAKAAVYRRRPSKVDLLFGPLAYRYMRGLRPDGQTVSRLVDLALEGLRPQP